MGKIACNGFVHVHVNHSVSCVQILMSWSCDVSGSCDGASLTSAVSVCFVSLAVDNEKTKLGSDLVTKKAMPYG